MKDCEDFLKLILFGSHDSFQSRVTMERSMSVLMWSYTFIEILSMWKPGIQADAHEVLIGILNSTPVASIINDLLQFEIVTTGS